MLLLRLQPLSREEEKKDRDNSVAFEEELDSCRKEEEEAAGMTTPTFRQLDQFAEKGGGSSMLRRQQAIAVPELLPRERENNTVPEYFPPWQEKRFYLMDGKDNLVILVDENWYCPVPFKGVKYDLPPTWGKPYVGLVTEILEGAAFRRFVDNSSAPIELMSDDVMDLPPDHPSCPFPDLENKELYYAVMIRNDCTPDPRPIQRGWEEYVKEACGGNPFESIWFQKHEPMITCMIQRKYDAQQAAQKNRIAVRDHFFSLLPENCWEYILPRLDGWSLLNLQYALEGSDAIKRCKAVLGSTSFANKVRDGRKETIWVDACLQLHRQMLQELLSSYSHYTKDVDNQYRLCMKKSSVEGTWSCEIIAAAEGSLIKTLRVGSVNFEIMNRFNNHIKRNLQMFVQEELGLEDFDEMRGKYFDHTVIVGTSGTLCYYCVSPMNNEENFFVFEGLENSQLRTCSSVCNYKVEVDSDPDPRQEIRYLKVMHLPRQPLSASSENRNPPYDRLVFSVSGKFTQVSPLHGDAGGFTIRHHIDGEITAGHFRNMEPILAFLDDNFVMWHSPMAVRFYRIGYISTQNRYQRAVFQKLNIRDGSKYWELMANNTQNFIPILKRKKLDFDVPDAIFDHYSLRNVDYYYELNLVNMRYGTDTVSIRNEFDMAPLHRDGPDVPFFKVHHTNPQYYYKNALKYRALIHTCNSGCQGFGLFVFWNHNAFAISWEDGIKWMFYPWTKVVNSCSIEESPHFNEAEELCVSQMCVVSSDVLAAVINSWLIVFKVEKKIGDFCVDEDNYFYRREPKLLVTPLRSCKIELQDMTVEQMTCSFDNGDPYFFFVMASAFKEDESPLDFWCSRIVFRKKKGQHRESIKRLVDSRIVISSSRKSICDDIFFDLKPNHPKAWQVEEGGIIIKDNGEKDWLENVE